MIERLCPHVKVAVGHGQMEGKKLEAVILDFMDGMYDVLEATTIVESGIDGTYILNKKSKPVIRALKSNLTDQINDSGQMDMSALMNIKDLYFDGDMEAAPALSGQSIGLINEVKSVKQIVDEIINEFNNTCESLGNIRF